MLDWSTVANWVVAILVPAVCGLIGFVMHLQREINDLKVKIATDYSGLPQQVHDVKDRLDKLSDEFKDGMEKQRAEMDGFRKEFLPLLYEIRGKLLGQVAG